jgi:hypothetical protein
MRSDFIPARLHSSKEFCNGNSSEAHLSSSICFSWHRKHYPQVKKFRLANEASSGTMKNLTTLKSSAYTLAKSTLK